MTLLGIMAGSVPSVTVTEVVNLDFSSVTLGDNVWLPQTGWQSYDTDDGGQTQASIWRTFRDGSGAVLYSADGAHHLTYDTGATGHESQADLRLYSSGPSILAGCVVAQSDASPLKFVGCELAITATENKVITYFRDGVTHDEFFMPTAYGLTTTPTVYTLRLRYLNGVVTTVLNGVVINTHTLTGPQQATLSGNQRAGVVNFAGLTNIDNLILRTVT